MTQQHVSDVGLSQNRFFEDQAFINYLAYLKYWKQPEYARFIM